ncbi:hypothetical protein VHEMI10757 [[Torrubiella] hemipterigena]|uniref:RNase H type-1 domain-containing protein n=1 Tax=[Torrubiella] hemipterigena TaxID=1531966 RepID=A0A0A1TSS2_9HYPO|nr:hypothetical protein VHEMI10757 [[Torrubiella] hemipterigena]
MVATGTIRLYTDGSGINGHVGAATIALELPTANVNKESSEYMRTASASTVYAAELKGLVLALQVIRGLQGAGVTASDCTIFTDNQAALQAMQNPKCPSGQHILIEVIRQLDCLRRLGWRIKYSWIPADAGVPGNEVADEAAKASAGFNPPTRRHEAPPEPERLSILIATTKATIRKTMKTEWESE